MIMLPIYGLFVLAHIRSVKNQQRILNDALRAFEIIRVKYGK